MMIGIICPPHYFAHFGSPPLYATLQHTSFEHLQHPHILEHAPPLYVTLQHIFWTCHNIMSEQNCRTTLEARCTIQGIQELWIVIFVSTNSFRYCCSVVSLRLIAMRMIWSPITPPMSVAPRGSRVWQPPTVPIMYCFFNYPCHYIKLSSTICTHSVLHFLRKRK